jgi:PPK2 family polyphosphate:nucleotide phosphotransferase
MSGINPQGCTVTSFKQPTPEELDHTFLWRYTKALPGRGTIGIFNRSYYEEVLVVRVHPELLERQNLPDPGGKTFWERRYRDINAFERHLAGNGTRILKFFLHVSKDEQARRLLERLDQPEKNWKFSPGDLAEREHWKRYQEAFEATLAETSTKAAPWWVIPADHKWVARSLVAAVITRELRDLGLRVPAVTARQRAAIGEARTRLRKDLRLPPLPSARERAR